MPHTNEAPNAQQRVPIIMSIIAKLIAKLKGTGAGSNGAAARQPGQAGKEINSKNIDLVGFVDYVVRSLVDHPEDVKIDTDKDDRGLVIKINCNKDEIRKIIGRNGKTINSIRSLVKGAARRLNQRANVIVVE